MTLKAWFSLRLLAIGISLVGFASFATIAAEDGSEISQQSEKYEKDIAAFNAIDPSFPPTILTRFEYSAYLSKQRHDHCAAHLDKADEERRQIETNTTAPLLLPNLSARLTYLRYSIAAGRAECATNKTQKRQWQQKARAETEAGIPLFLAVHQYLDMVTAQFNLAEMDLQLGNHDLAVQELQEALRMDEHYGLREDAEENLRYLGRWQNREVSDGEVADFLNRFADRDVTPTFDWKPGVSTWSEDITDSRLQSGKLTQTSTHISGTETLRRADNDLLQDLNVSDLRITTTPSEQIPDQDSKLSVTLAKILAVLPTIRLSQHGQFKGLDHVQEFTAEASKKFRDLPGQLLPVGDPKRGQLERNSEQLINTVLTEDSLKESARDDTNIETGIWEDLTLTQGESRQLSAKLSMAGIPGAFIEHDVSVQFTDRVPCTAAQTSQGCVELLLFADPKDSAVQGIHDQLAKDGKGNLAYWAATRFRIVVDPATLHTYARETARYSYVLLDSGKEHQIDMESRVSSTTMGDVTP
jgi:tetratricopeptide (TPR) repeat protein